MARINIRAGLLNKHTALVRITGVISTGIIVITNNGD
jgi:hypothetical protein